MKGQRFMAGRKVRAVHGALWMVAAAALSDVASADVSARRLRDAGAERVLEATASRRDRVEVIAKVPRAAASAVASEAGASEIGLVPIVGDWAAFRGDLAGFDRVLTTQRSADWFFAPRKRLMMDLAGPTIALPESVEEFGVDGSGVVVGVVDTGLDFRHPAFLNVDGTTRVAWLLSFGQAPRGIHADLEADIGCTEYGDCAVFSGAEIDQLLASGDQDQLPVDSIGHGSHVTGIAAGRDASFPGVAPGAQLIVVQAAGDGGSASDAGILSGVRFVFDRASELGLPAVVNLSLGSSFGAHDGTSALEQVIDELSAGPGRVVVVASGNDAGLFDAANTRYPDPLGIHAEAMVPGGADVRVPLYIGSGAGGALSGYAFAWISSNPGDELALALDTGRGVITPRIESGETAYFTSADLGDADDYELVILNGAEEGAESDIKTGSLVLGLSGTISPDRQFELVLSGHGTAKVWVEGGGDLNSLVLLPRARAGGTVTIPATAQRVISVGASVNRESWTDYVGQEVQFPLGAPGSRAYFSGAGPSQVGSVEPDLLAPGAYVVSAMAGPADPRANPSGPSQFASFGLCPDPSIECFVVDDLHGVSAGTSMAAPLVTGAVALLLQRDPELDALEARDLLRGGAASPRPSGALVGDGTGILDIRRALLAQDLAAGGGERLPHADFTRVAAADVYLQASGQPLEISVILRDAEGQPAGGFLQSRLTVDVAGPASVDGIELHPGLLRFWLRATAGSGQREATVQVSFDGAALADATLPITVDSSVYREGFALGGGGCQVAVAGDGSSRWSLGLLFALGFFGLSRFRRRSALAQGRI